MATGEKPGVVIYPTSTCFDDAFEIVLAIARVSRKRARRMRIVHALCLFDEKLAAHAWVEEGTRCYFAGILKGQKEYFKLHRTAYYQQVHVQEVTRYPIWEIFQRQQAGALVHTGPWEEKYKPYVRQGEDEDAGA